MRKKQGGTETTHRADLIIKLTPNFDEVVLLKSRFTHRGLYKMKR